MVKKRHSLREVRRSGAVLITGKAIHRIFVLLRNMLMAAAFGGAAEISAFMIAFRLVNVPWAIFGGGALTGSFIPRFQHLIAKDEMRAYAFFRDLWALLAVVTLALSLLIICLLSPIFFLAPLSGTLHLVVMLLILLAPCLVMMSLSALQAALLACHRRFFLAGLAPAGLNAVWAVAVILLWKSDRLTAAIWLSVALVIGYMLTWLLTLPPSLRLVIKELGAQLWKGMRPFGKDVRRVGRAFSVAVISYGSLQVNTALDPIFARIASPAGPAYLWYAGSVTAFALMVFGGGFAGVFLPALSRALKLHDEALYRRLLLYADDQALKLMLPFTFGFLAIGLSLVNLLYGRAQFLSSDAVQTTHCLWIFALGLLPETMIVIQTGAFFAQHLYHVPAVLTVLSMTTNVLLNLLFVVGLGFGAPAVALATTISMSAQCLLLYWSLHAHGFGIPLRSHLPLASKLVACGILSLAVTLLVDWWFFEAAVWRVAMGGVDIELRRSLGAQLTHCFTLAVCFLAVFYLAALLFRVGRGKRRYLWWLN